VTTNKQHPSTKPTKFSSSTPLFKLTHTIMELFTNNI